MGSYTEHRSGRSGVLQPPSDPHGWSFRNVRSQRVPDGPDSAKVQVTGTEHHYVRRSEAARAVPVTEKVRGFTALRTPHVVIRDVDPSPCGRAQHGRLEAGSLFRDRDSRPGRQTCPGSAGRQHRGHGLHRRLRRPAAAASASIRSSSATHAWINPCNEKHSRRPQHGSSAPRDELDDAYDLFRQETNTRDIAPRTRLRSLSLVSARLAAKALAEHQRHWACRHGPVKHVKRKRTVQRTRARLSSMRSV